MRIETLTRQQCIGVVSVQRLARLVCAKNGQPYVVSDLLRF
jgi:nitroimidazol reductase NimA-like FMN-containing flavoprotein (pyridoxamine 5'-phosphate oxidase superfamily)